MERDLPAGLLAIIESSYPEQLLAGHALVKLVVAAPDPARWQDTGVIGELVVLYDAHLDTVFFQIYDVDSLRLLFDFEVYEDMEYIMHPSFPRLQTFEMEAFMAGFCFSDEEQALSMHAAVVPSLPKSVHKFDVVRERAVKSASVGVRLKRLFTRGGSGGAGKPAAASSVGALPGKRHAPPQPAPPARTSDASIEGNDSASTDVQDEWIATLKQAGISKSDMRDPSIIAALATAMGIDPASDPAFAARRSVHSGASVTPSMLGSAETPSGPSKLDRSSSRGDLHRRRSITGPALTTAGSTEDTLAQLSRDINPILVAKKMETIRTIQEMGRRGSFRLRPADARRVSAGAAPREQDRSMLDVLRGAFESRRAVLKPESDSSEDDDNWQDG